MEAIGWLLLGLAAWETLWGRNEASAGRRGLWCGLLVAAFYALRWPILSAPYELSPDESQSLAGAITLWADPLFWRSVDGATAGPLHFYMLMPAALFSDTAAYFAARVIGGGLMLGTIFLAGAIVRRFADPRSERVAVLLAVAACALTQTPDLHHTSTELLPVFLVTLAIAAYVNQPHRRSRLWLAGIALGLVPWAKLQVAPMALVAGIAGVIAEWRSGRHRDAIMLAVAGLLPTLIVEALAISTGVASDMITSYFLANAGYASNSLYSPFSALAGFCAAVREDGYAAIWMAGGIILAGASLVISRGRFARGAAAWAGAWWIVAVLCVAWTRRPFLHYWHLLVPPWVILSGLAWARISAEEDGFRRAWFLRPRVLALLMLFALVGYRVAGPRHFDWVHAIFARYGRENRELAGVARQHVVPGDRLAIWGNRSGLYVAAGLPAGTRQAHTEMQIRNGPLRSYFLRTWWQDFASTRPAIFADATGPGNIGFDEPNHSPQAFPPLAETLRRDYTLVRDQFGVRLYLRNDRLPAKAASAAAGGAP